MFLYLDSKVMADYQDLIRVQGIEFESVGILTMNNSKNYSANAIPFITFHEGQGFALSQEAEEFIGSLAEDRQLGIVSIVGKYRTGKSFFVNRVLLDQKKGGFQVGPTINPCTKGLWLWKKTIPSTSNQNMDIIMIDTEGFGGMDENTNHDSRIFLFSLLLSSFFIYNSVGNIDENALTTINLILNLAKEIQTKSNGKVGEDVSSFPAFLWVVRDFALMLQDKSGNKINSKEYLQNSLEEQKGASDAVENKNKIRRHLKHFFQDRDCELMVRPTEREKDLQRLDEIDNQMLRPEFVNQVEAIRKKIYRSVKPKKVNDKILNGPLLVSLCKGYMDSINKGNIPTVESAWFYVCRNQGIKAIREATDYLDSQIAELLKQPLNIKQMETLKTSLRQQVMTKFKKKSLNSQDGHPDLLQKLQKRIEESFNSLIRKNKSQWQDCYKDVTDKVLDTIKDKIYSDSYEEFSDFVRDFEMVKHQYDFETSDGDSVQKWKYFNQISENLYRLAGQTITSKINKNLHKQKTIMQQKLQKQQEEIEEKHLKLQGEKQNYRSKIQLLEKENAKLIALEDSHKNRALQYKSQHDKIYDKYRTLYNEHEETQILFQKSKKEVRKLAQNDMEEVKGQLVSIRSTLEKQRALHEMEKKYMEEQLDRYKERSVNLESQCRKLRTNNSKLTSDYEDLQNQYEEKKEEAQILSQTNTSFSKKIETLIAENSMKSEIMGDHSEWMLEKSYLQNQVSFLKNTLNQNKRLHDALLVALQQSISTSQTQSSAQLVEANKNLSSALQKIEGRCRILEQKYDRVKDFKKVMKSCLSMQCANCTKHIQSHMFSTHLDQCLSGSMVSMKEKVNLDNNKQNLHISVSQTVVKQTEDKKKAYTEYKIQINMGESKWRVSKRYKEFSQLQQMLINKYPTIRYPQSCSFLVDINNLMANKQKNIMAEQRRKNLQQYLRDLSKIQEIRNSDIFKIFLEFPEYCLSEHKSHSKYVEISEKKQRLYL